MKRADKHFRCTVCQRGFTRIDHLKRHHLRHSGQKPYSCIFCNEAFARCDNLRDHYSDCAQRGDRAIPETGQRGRRRHACQSCTSMKLRCDGQSPCGSCVKRNLECNNAQNAHPFLSTLDEDKPVTYAQSSERGSIKFLLNNGTDSFTEQMHLPPRSDRALGVVYHNQVGSKEESGATLPYNVQGVQGTRQDYTIPSIDSDPTSLQFFKDNFLDCFSGPFGDGQKPVESLYTGQCFYRPSLDSELDPDLSLPPGRPIFEPERPFATALLQSILARAWTVPLDVQLQGELSASLSFLLTTTRIRKFILMYFKYWQPSCALIHAPSFDPETAPLPLLAAVVFMGAMYSTDQKEEYIAKRVLDFAELFIFSSPIFSPENEVVAVFSGNWGTPNEDTDDWTKFQHFQAGFIMLSTQYWAGSQASRNRAMESRFSDILKSARSLGLFRVRHAPLEQQSESRWIQTECQIRTVSYISLLDCAFFFYQNYPCRVSRFEMEYELPSEDSFFQSEHPFSEPTFSLTRGTTVYMAFQMLFRSPSVDCPQASPGVNHMHFTVLHMFILIHALFAFINTHITYVGLSRRPDQAIQSSQDSSGHTVERSIIPEDSILGSIRTALSRWRDYWATLRSQVPTDEWESMGFYKNAYNFWLISQLLITKKDAIDVIMQMEVKCEDKLEKLKVLLDDEQE